jgi:S1-C subfamily serine protease
MQYYGAASNYRVNPHPPTRVLPPAPERREGLSGTFYVLIFIVVLVVGTLGYQQGVFGSHASSSAMRSDGGSGGSDSDVMPVSTPLTSEDAAALQSSVGPGLVNITAALPAQHAVGAGTGIVLESGGVVLTNNHVIRGASSIRVTSIGNGRTYAATVVGYNSRQDIAVLKLRGASGLHTATIGDSDSVEVGDQVAAIGNAGGVGGKPSVATGPVTDLDRTITTTDDMTGRRERLTGLIEANARVEPGDSGGPMVNTRGEVIGVDVAASVDARSQQPDGTGFAIPINRAIAVANEIRSGADSDAVHIGETAMLGVNPVDSGPLTREVIARLGEPSLAQNDASGAYVANVVDSSPAASAGLRRGDVITALDGRTVVDAESLLGLMNRHHPGDKVVVNFVRPNGEQRVTQVLLTAMPPN